MPQPNIVVDDGRVVGANSWTDGFKSVQAHARRVVSLTLDAAKEVQVKRMLLEGDFETALTFADEIKDKSVLVTAAQMIVDRVDPKNDPIDSIVYKYMLCAAFGQTETARKLRPTIRERYKEVDTSLRDKLQQFDIYEKNPRLLGDRPLLSLVPLP